MDVLTFSKRFDMVYQTSNNNSNRTDLMLLQGTVSPGPLLIADGRYELMVTINVRNRRVDVL
jgi:hypothetical protein